MRRQQFLSTCLAFVFGLVVAVGCANNTPETVSESAAPAASSAPLVIGYSNWPGWLPWAVAEEKGLFAANGANVELKWFDGYLASMEAFAAGQLDGNSQTLNDTISFAADAVNGEVAVLVNDNSAGNDKVVVAEGINSIEDLKDKTIALEEGVVGDFMLTQALEQAGMSRSDITIKNLETGAAAAAFASGQVDAFAGWPPFWGVALERPGSKELLSSKEYPGIIPDLLVVSQKVIDEQPDQVQALVNTWFATLDYIAKNPEESNKIMAARSGVSVEEYEEFQAGTRIFTIEENLEAFTEGNGMKHMPFAAQKMNDFMVDVGFIEAGPDDLGAILDDSFVKAYAEGL
ncbi:sulfonate abc transporter substrate-binding protein [Leptolyngbya sp. Heron Island J]|uniref:ABC transporter substrate-binding protein n=1 Tax=Leptolyngbya sp. Heron Island J TaxID=1385935 RepID=UPI0003B99EF9|nr:ABC transporter substrate-binding protein [Leptolyngbya sp. Heron Island J]ESA32246.1 sulfonate abc transporter substrate-binding protein [Leptolyngbya sp. Heron Island J]